MPRLTEATKQARRRQIIDAAFTCFTAKGYTHTSMTDIIRESGLSSGSIYSHFSGKSDILYATVQQRIDMIAAAYQELDDPSPRDIMRMIFATSTVEANFTSMLRIRLESFTVPEVQESTNTLFTTLHDIVAQSLIPWGQRYLEAENKRKPSADELHSFVSDTADALILTFQGFMVRSALSSSTDREHLFDIALNLLPE
ncbi:TetR/AcrR family transcriptional regulator [Rothia aeria]|uniref:Transcriptional regulator, TetR family n=1 Tax=Rothia aeria F0474 TaxID=1125724 RepID=I0USC1_9MICC|nr:TetR/AcrR family transcriptional regulator [Rothia aeria]EID50774.1 transcriptional regulator, TetR family [Rothia aeria F0474]MDK7351931.1 TetR/AcrR family transcriptional regulator [Rothia aeria]